MNLTKTKWLVALALLLAACFAYSACGAASSDDGSDDAIDGDDDASDDDDADGGGDDDSSGGEPEGVFSLKLMDAPVDDADAITITLTGLQVHYSDEWPEGDDDDDDDDGDDDDSGDDDDDDEEPAGYGNGPDDDDDSSDDDDDDDDDSGDDDGECEGTWIDLPLEVTTINLLELQNGINAMLSEAELPAGHYTQIRLFFDCDENPPTITIDGEVFELFIPSGCESGVKLTGGWDLVAGESLSLILDFDLRRSVNLTGSGHYILRPTIRVIEEDLTGRIAGSVLPPDIGAVVYAYPDGSYPDGDYENSTMPDDTGAWVLAALPAGIYDVVAEAEGYEPLVIEDVTVTAEETTEVGTIEFSGTDE